MAQIEADYNHPIGPDLMFLDMQSQNNETEHRNSIMHYNLQANRLLRITQILKSHSIHHIRIRVMGL